MAVPVRSGPLGRSGFGVMGGPRGEAGPMRSGGPRVGAEIRCPGSPMSLAPMVANGGGWVIRFCRWPRAPGPGSGTLGHRRARRPGWPPVAVLCPAGRWRSRYAVGPRAGTGIWCPGSPLSSGPRVARGGGFVSVCMLSTGSRVSRGGVRRTGVAGGPLAAD